MGNQSDSGGVSDAEGQDRQPSVWARATTTISTLWPIPWPMATGILLILLVGWLVPLVPDALNGVGQGIAVAWNWLRLTGDGSPAVVTNAETVRNVSLTLGGPLALVALWLAWRRTFDARRQTETQIQQSRFQARQTAAVEQSNRDDRYREASKSIVSDISEERIAGIFTLDKMKMESPEIYHIQITRQMGLMLSDMIDDKDDIMSMNNFQFGWNKGNEVIQAFMLIGQRREIEIEIEERDIFNIAMVRCCIPPVRIRQKNYSRIFFMNSVFVEGMTFQDCSLDEARWQGCQLSKCAFLRGSMNGAKFMGTNLSGTVFRDVAGLDLNAFKAAKIDRSDPTTFPIVWESDEQLDLLERIDWDA